MKIAWLGLVSLVVGCAGGSRPPATPAIAYTPDSIPQSPDTLYFGGACSEQPSAEEALRCARVDALSELAIWIGGTLTVSVSSVSSERGRADQVRALFESSVRLAGPSIQVRHHSVEKRGDLSYHAIGVQLKYPRTQAIADRELLAADTEAAEQLIQATAADVDGFLRLGRWKAAMDRITASARELSALHDLAERYHLLSLADLALELTEGVDVALLRADAAYRPSVTHRGVPVLDFPLEASIAGDPWRPITVVVGEPARIRIPTSSLRVVRVRLRPAAARLQAALPIEYTTAFGAAVSALLRYEWSTEVAPKYAYTFNVHAAPPCERARVAAVRTFRSLGRPATGRPPKVIECQIRCTVHSGSKGRLYTAVATGELVIHIGNQSTGASGESAGTASVQGLGATEEAATEQALDRAGEVVAQALIDRIEREGG